MVRRRSTSRSSVPELIGSQESSLQSLRQRLNEFSVFSAELEAHQKNNPFPPAAFKQPRQTNAFALHGPRGAGKTTVLQSLLKPESRHLLPQNFKTIPHPVDGSLIRGHIPPGLALLLQLRRALESERVPAPDLSRDAVKNAQKAFESMKNGYMTLLPEHRELSVKLAVSHRGLNQLAAESIKEHLELPRLIFDWISCELALWSPEYSGFLVVLDDVDLMAHGLGSSLVWSLLDELHQPGLALIIAGDLKRLEGQVMAHPDGAAPSEVRPPRHETAQHEQETAQQLLYKAIPGKARITLDPWTVNMRKSFPPSQSRKASSIEELFGQSFLRDHQDLLELLPRWPRGLENVYRFLQDEDKTPRPLFRERYLPFLAEAQGEMHIAEQLKEGNMLATLLAGFAHTELSEGQWRIWSNEAWLGHALQSTPGLADKNFANVLAITHLASKALWSETIIDQALRHGPNNRADLLASTNAVTLLLVLDAQIGLRKRLEASVISAQIPDTRVENWISDSGSQLPWCLWYTQWEQTPFQERQSNKLLRVQAGWWPLFSGLHSRRNCWPAQLFQSLFMAPPEELELKTNELRIGQTHVDLAPYSFRALILLAAAIERASFHTLSGLGWSWDPPLLAMAAAGCILQTYLFALGRSPANSPTNYKELASWFHELHSEAMEVREEQIEGPPTLRVAHRALQEALSRYLDHEALTGPRNFAENAGSS